MDFDQKCNVCTTLGLWASPSRECKHARTAEDCYNGKRPSPRTDKSGAREPPAAIEAGLVLRIHIRSADHTSAGVVQLNRAFAGRT